MKKLFILSFVALSVLTANAQTDKEAAAAAKQAAKELKVKQAAELKAYKEKQKADLAAFIEKQKSGAATTAIVSKDDSIAHLYGTALSRGLKEYAVMQLGVDSTQIEEFTKGILDNIVVEDTSTPEKKAYNAGKTIGTDIVGKTQAFSNSYYGEEGKSVNPSIVGEALVAGLLGKSDIDPNIAGQQLQDIMQKREAEIKEAKYGPNRDAGEAWLEANKKKEGVVVLPSGLQYKVITMGEGEKPSRTDKVKVHYEGKLIDGTVFDSSYKRGQPTSFGVTQVIKGWTEALQLMPVGSKWELYIPYQLAYGDRETGKEIKPYSALTFVVELLDIEQKSESKTETKPAEADTKSTAKKSAKKSAKK